MYTESVSRKEQQLQRAPGRGGNERRDGITDICNRHWPRTWSSLEMSDCMLCESIHPRQNEMTWRSVHLNNTPLQKWNVNGLSAGFGHELWPRLQTWYFLHTVIKNLTLVCVVCDNVPTAWMYLKFPSYSTLALSLYWLAAPASGNGNQKPFEQWGR